MEEGPSLRCFNCSQLISLLPGPVGRRESCSSCGADVRVCKNCAHYDTSKYNDCNEPNAERVVDKEKANFCDLFRVRSRTSESSSSDAKQSALAALDNLFSKKT